MTRQLKPRPRAGGRWTEARFFGFVRGHLRNAFRRWPPKFDVLNKASRKVTGKRWKTEYQCAKCSKWYKQKDVEVDHIDSCGSLKTFDDLPTFTARLFCEEEGMQVLCKPCHRSKTNDSRKRK